MNTLQKFLGTALIAVVATSAQAASISLVYNGPNDLDTDGAVLAQINDTLTFDIIMDFSDEATLGGGFDLTFDPSELAFQDFFNNEIGEDGFGRDPDVSDGLLESWAFGAFAGLSGPDTVGSVTFVYLGGGPAMLSLGATSGLGGPFISAADNTSLMSVDFGSATVNPVPLPAAAWFFLSGLGALFGMSRRQSRV